MTERHFPGKFILLGCFALAMAYLESAVVVYLRLLYYPEGFTVILKPMPPSVYLIEMGREAATLVMLFCVARLSFPDFWQRFAAFSFMFGVWDVFYYVWLYAFIQWPPSLFTWDILFLIPVAWIGPVWSPVLVSINLIMAAVFLTCLTGKGIVLRPAWYHWAVAIVGAMILFASYVAGVTGFLKGTVPVTYHWKWLVAGLVLGWGAFFWVLLGKRSKNQ
jgi:hypothetical protein